ncbi:MAG: EamA family transporter [Acidobacteriia bacterium]|nr:EamA family transporter [Terriglobia bacterium]
MSTAAVNSSSATTKHAARRAARESLLLTTAFAAVYLVWGSTYFAIRIGLESFPPLLLAGSRHLLAGLVLYPILRWKTGIRPTAAQWRAAAITGCLLLFVSNGGVCWAEQTVPSGITALLVATVSLWLVLVEWLRPGGTRPGLRVVVGLLLGFAGLALLVGPAHLGGSERVHLGGAAILVVASFSWACGSLYSKHCAHPASPLLGVAMQSLAGGAVLWIVGLLLGEGRTLAHAGVSLRSGVALGYLTVFGSGIGFTAYLYLLKKTTPSRVGTYAFVNPVVALLLGWAFAGEAVTLRTWLAAAVILTAVILVISAPHRMPGHEADAIPTPGEA